MVADFVFLKDTLDFLCPALVNLCFRITLTPVEGYYCMRKQIFKTVRCEYRDIAMKYIVGFTFFAMLNLR
jgi:hypothetical protein